MLSLAQLTNGAHVVLQRAKLWTVRHRQQSAYALGGFAQSILGTLFKLFNVALFTQVVGLGESSFYLGHAV